MTVTGGSALGKEDIDKMVKDAEAHAEEDRKRREAVEMRNEADALAFRTEKLLADNAEQIGDDVKAPVQESLDKLKEALKGTDNDEDVKAAMNDLNEKSSAMGQAMYAAAQAHHLLDAGLLQDGDPFLAGTAPISLARVSPQTAADFDLVDGAPVTVSTGHGAVTLPLEVTPMVDRVVWLPANSAGCRVRATLDAQPGDVVNLSKGGVA